MLILAGLIAGCAKTDKNAESMAKTVTDTALAPGPAPAVTPAAPAVTDPQIAAIVVAANDVDIAAGRLALTHAHNAEVKAFAKQMITDHSMVNKQAKDLVTKLKVTPESNATSEKLTQDGEATRKTL